MRIRPGDIIRYAAPAPDTGRKAMFPDGQPLVIEEVDEAECVARFAFNVTRFRILIADTAPFPSGITIAAAALEALRPIKGRLAEVHHEQMLDAYRLLVGSGHIPSLEEERSVRAPTRYELLTFSARLASSRCNADNGPSWAGEYGFDVRYQGYVVAHRGGRAVARPHHQRDRGSQDQALVGSVSAC